MKKILIILSFFLVLISTSIIGYKIVSANEQVEEIKDILLEQEELETYLTPYGYTLDNPNIIINPYGISPLTAIILFETKTEEEVAITIEGKDENSTYTNHFKSTTKHSIPIYGLYPNTINKIHIQCGTLSKTIEIKTTPLPNDLNIKTTNNNTNNLTFITTDTYPYAIDNNNEVRWYLTKNYSKKITRLQNSHLLLSNDMQNQNKKPIGLIEIDLLGKIYKQYNIENGYYGSYAETSNTLFVLSNNLLEIEKQTGTILNTFLLKKSYNEVLYNQKDNTITLTNQTESNQINLTTKEEITKNTPQPLSNNQETLLPLYSDNKNYEIIKGIKFTTNQKTKESKQNIYLIGYKKIDQNYKDHNIKIIKTPDTIQVTGTFQKNETVFLILDKFLDKKIYDITSNQTIISKEGLSGKYSIYLKINNTLYKTNTYINF